MITILVIGIISIIFGILFVFSPTLLEKINEWGNKIIITDDFAISYRHISGILLILIGIVFLLISLGLLL